MSGGRRDAVALAGLVALAFAVRLRFRIDYDEDIDALRFALGVDRFDVAALRPHAPYYPVFVAAAKLVALLGASPRGALAVVSAASGAATVGFTALLADAAVGRRAARLAALLAVTSPFLWLTSEKLLSDMAGAAGVTAALWLCARARSGPEATRSAARTIALVVLGVGLGVRLSYFPVALACLAVIATSEGGVRAWTARARDLATGALAWLVPLVLVAPPRDLVATTWIQGVGHFTRWGGTAITVSSPRDRLYGVAWGLWANGLGGAWPDAPRARWLVAPVLALLLLAAAARAATRRTATMQQPELWASAIAYFAWALLGQNIAFKPRHWLPLVPLLLVALAAGADALSRAQPGRSSTARAGSGRAGHRWPAAAAYVVVAALAAQWSADALALVRRHQEPSPAAAIIAFLRDHGDDDRPIVTRDLGRMIAEGARDRHAVTVAGDAALVAAVEQAGPRGALITGEALSEAALAALAARGYAVSLCFARPRSPYVDALWSQLALLEARRVTDASGRDDHI